jgi:hypothetical protein
VSAAWPCEWQRDPAASHGCSIAEKGLRDSAGWSGRDPRVAQGVHWGLLSGRFDDRDPRDEAVSVGEVDPRWPGRSPTPGRLLYGSSVGVLDRVCVGPGAEV